MNIEMIISTILLAIALILTGYFGGCALMDFRYGIRPEEKQILSDLLADEIDQLHSEIDNTYEHGNPYEDSVDLAEVQKANARLRDLYHLQRKFRR